MKWTQGWISRAAFIAFFALGGSLRATAESAPTPQPPKGISSAAEDFCDLEGREAQIEAQLGGGTALVVCSARPDDSKMMVKGLHLHDFSISLLPKGEPVYRSQSLTEHYSLIADAFPFRFIRLLWNPSTKVYHPLTLAEITCGQKHCKVSKPGCALNLPKNPFPSAVQALKVYGKNKDQKVYSGPIEVDLEKSVFHALSGNAEARDLFLKDSAGLKEKLDGTALETFDEGVELLNHAKRAGCRI